MTEPKNQPPSLRPASVAAPFELRGEHIALDALLKATGLAASGGHAKLLIQGGEVLVDGAVETRRSAKLRAGQCVQWQQRQVLLQAGPAD
jgi:ribosome-associated protein